MNFFHNKFSVMTVSTILFICGVAVLFLQFGVPLLFPATEPAQTNTNVLVTNQAATNTQELTNENPTGQPTATGRLLFVKDHDVWVSSAKGESPIKLIDGDTIINAKYSDDLNHLAYAKRASGPIAGEKNVNANASEFERVELYVASSIGDRSLRVSEAVTEWGWVPNTTLLWFETAELQELFGWQYWSSGKIFLVDSAGDRPELLMQGDGFWSILGPQWDPTGKKITYVRTEKDQPYTLTVMDRQTKKSTSLMELPYMGGDRGGPAPIPTVWWNNDGTKLYTGFTPLGFFANTPGATLADEYKLGMLLIYEIPLDTGQPQLLTSAVSCGMNEELYPPIIFSEDFKQVIYPRIHPDVDTSSFERDSYWSCQKNPSQELVVEDLQTHRITSLIPSIEKRSWEGPRAFTPVTFTPREAAFLIEELDEQVELLAIRPEATPMVQTALVAPFRGKQPRLVWKNFSGGGTPESQYLLLDSVGTYELLFFQGTVPGVSADQLAKPILEGVTDVQYYPVNL